MSYSTLCGLSIYKLVYGKWGKKKNTYFNNLFTVNVLDCLKSQSGLYVIPIFVFSILFYLIIYFIVSSVLKIYI